MTDPIADLLTRIRNALHARHERLVVPSSNLKTSVTEILKRRGFIRSWRVVDKDVQADIEIELRYMQSGEPAIRGLKRISSPGCRIYSKKKDIKPLLAGRGVSIYSTPKGVLSGEDALKQSVGGELLCQVW